MIILFIKCFISYNLFFKLFNFNSHYTLSPQSPISFHRNINIWRINPKTYSAFTNPSDRCHSIIMSQLHKKKRSVDIKNQVTALLSRTTYSGGNQSNTYSSSRNQGRFNKYRDAFSPKTDKEVKDKISYFQKDNMEKVKYEKVKYERRLKQAYDKQLKEMEQKMERKYEEKLKKQLNEKVKEIKQEMKKENEESLKEMKKELEQQMKKELKNMIKQSQSKEYKGLDKITEERSDCSSDSNYKGISQRQYNFNNANEGLKKMSKKSKNEVDILTKKDSKKKKGTSKANKEVMKIDKEESKEVRKDEWENLGKLKSSTQ